MAAALLAALAGHAAAASQTLAAADPLLIHGTPAERADALAGIANLAQSLDDVETERQAREAAVAALREAGDDRETLVQLSMTLYNLAMCYARLARFTEAVQALEEVVALDERTGHPDLASDRAVLEQMRQRAAGLPGEGLSRLPILSATGTPMGVMKRGWRWC